MASTARNSRACVARAVRVGMLAVMAVGYLPVPVVHTHAGASPRLARHLALLHGGRVDASGMRPHVHVVPRMFLAGGGLGDATGEESPPSGGDDVISAEVACVEAPVVSGQVIACLAESQGIAQSTALPRHFFETFPAGADLGGLIGVCRC